MPSDLFSLAYWRACLPPELAEKIRGVERTDTGHHSVIGLATFEDGLWFAKFAQASHVQHESEVIQQLRANKGTHALAPKLIHASHQQGLLITQACKGQHPSKPDWQLNLDSFLASLLALHNRLHKQAISLPHQPSPRFELFAANPDAGFAKAFEAAKRRALTTKPHLGLLHGDVNPKNLLLDDAKWCLIDWEYAHIGDKHWDLASLAVELDLTGDEYLGLIHRYCAMGNFEFDAFFATADDWLVLYINICLGWCHEFGQPSDKYWRFYRRYFSG